jgi:hypothetical protein
VTELFHVSLLDKDYVFLPQVLNHDLIMWRIDILDRLCDITNALEDISTVNALELLLCKH